MCVKVFIYWYLCSEWGFWWLIWNICYNLSGVLIFIVIGFISLIFGWCYGFLFAGGVVIFVGFWFCYCI